MDVSRAQLSNLGNQVVLEDPAFPWTIRVHLDQEAETPSITTLTVQSRQNDPITSTTLARIPARQIASVAASALRGDAEAQYRMLALPRPEGMRSWPEDHYRRVGTVAAWAKAVGRTGGPARAIAEFWAVDYRTARRWLARLK